MAKQERAAVGQRLQQQRNRLNLTWEQFAELVEKVLQLFHLRDDCLAVKRSAKKLALLSKSDFSSGGKWDIMCASTNCGGKIHDQQQRNVSDEAG